VGGMKKKTRGSRVKIDFFSVGAVSGHASGRARAREKASLPVFFFFFFGLRGFIPLFVTGLAAHTKPSRIPMPTPPGVMNCR